MKRTLILLAIVLQAALACQDPPPVDPKMKEAIEFGTSAAAEIEKQFKIVSDPAMNERVSRIGQALAEIARKTPVEAHWGEERGSQFEYKFKILDEKDVNAFSIPGGFIYVHKSLLDFVQSDHELAGVLAHEIAHAAHYHVMKLIAEDNKVNRQVMLPVLIGALIGKLPTEDTINLYQGAALYRVAKINSFGQEAEIDADMTAIEYLRRSDYNPVGLLTFLERLQAEERKRPQLDWGVFRTHPPTRDRVKSVLGHLAKHNLPVKRREVSPGLRIIAKELAPDRFEVRLETISIFTTAEKDKAEKIALRLNAALDDGLELYEIQMGTDGRSVFMRGEPLIEVSEADAKAAGDAAENLARAAREAIRRLLWADAVRRS
ncbi:MAG: M48 family metalloprotease [Armatimonadetes bacterium]|nr:M48 family metalloprotease [Armatimonadota bacterium]